MFVFRSPPIVHRRGFHPAHQNPPPSRQRQQLPRRNLKCVRQLVQRFQGGSSPVFLDQHKGAVGNAGFRRQLFERRSFLLPEETEDPKVISGHYLSDPPMIFIISAFPSVYFVHRMTIVRWSGPFEGIFDPSYRASVSRIFDSIYSTDKNIRRKRRTNTDSTSYFMGVEPIRIQGRKQERE
jgi:hypothetical protein